MALVSPPTNVGLVLRIQPDGSLAQMTGELGPAGAAGLGSGVIVVVNLGIAQQTPVGVIIQQINQSVGFPPPFSQRFVLDWSTMKVNTF